MAQSTRRTFLASSLAASLGLLAPPGAAEAARNLRVDRVAVDPSVTFQTLEGWGTSLAWWAHVIGGFPANIRRTYMERIFDPRKGLGLTVARYNIGGGENPNYHFLSHRTAVPGFQPRRDHWDWDADKNQRWVLHEAMRRGVQHVEAFANSPPWWMTRSGSVTGAKNGGNNLKLDDYGAFAHYLALVVRRFHTHWGVNFASVEPLNEPVSPWWRFGNHQEGCHFDRPGQQEIIRRLGAALHSRGMRTPVSAPDENNINQTVTSFESYDRVAKRILGRINTHSYGGNERVQLCNLAMGYGKGLWMSEYGDGDATGIPMSLRILEDMKLLRPTAWVYWQAVDSAGGWGFMRNPLTGAGDTGMVVNQKYFVMANYSRFITPGCRFIAVDDAHSLAAHDPHTGRLIMVATNPTDEPRGIEYDLAAFSEVGGAVSTYLTSGEHQLRHSPGHRITGKRLRVTLPAKSVTTLVVPRARFHGDQQFVSGRYYHIINRPGRRELSVQGDSPGNGAELVESPRSGAWKNQWFMLGFGDGKFALVNRASGLVATASGGGRHAALQQKPFGGSGQIWKLVRHGGHFSIKNPATGGALSLQRHARRVTLAPISGTSFEQWQIALAPKRLQK